MAALICLFSSAYGQNADAIQAKNRLPDSQIRSDVMFYPAGGPGGGAFSARCPQNELLTGFDLWTGDDVDAIHPICEPIAGGPSRSTAGKYGGNGGSERRLLCPHADPFVIGMLIDYYGAKTVIVNSLYLYCGKAVVTPQPTEVISAQFEGGYPGGCDLCLPAEDQQVCPEGRVAVGITGRSGIWLDAVGLICGDPRVLGPGGAPVVEKDVIKGVGRTKLPPGSQPNGPPLSICEAARQARARNSPATAGLEAQCAAEAASLDLNGLSARGLALAGQDHEIQDAALLQGTEQARIGFYIGVAASEGQTLPGPGKQRIHDALPVAQQEGFNAAVTFMLLRNRKRIADLAPQGAAIAAKDAVIAKARDEQTTDAARKGFDIGVAAADGQTSMNDTIANIRASLSPAEQAGFDSAVTLSLARHKEKSTNAAYDMAPRGRMLANQDPLAAQLRRQQLNDDYRTGFDVGMAAAEGQTLPGPNKDRMRNLLTGPERAGFDAAVAFSLERNRNADLAAVGARIADRDDVVATLRDSDRDVFYRLGFDIASGIFGDPKLGAKGNTQTGPGSMRIRDALSAAGQKGFDAAVKLHLSRKY